MLKLLFLLTIVLIFAGGGFFLYQNFQTKLTPPAGGLTPTPQAIQTPTTATQPTSSPTTSNNLCEVLTKGSADLPPLYKEGINWQNPAIAEREIGEFENPSTGEGFISTRKTGCLTKSTATLDFANQLRNFYIEKLSKNGWKLVDTADGPSSFLITYKKDRGYILLNRLNDQIELFYTQ